MNSKIRNVVVISDTHCGCRLGLCRPEGTSLDDGGEYRASRMQKVVWSWWEEFWNDWVPKVTRKEPFVLVHNGDVIDGVHHNSTTQISHNILDQKRMAIDILRDQVEKADTFYSVRGTAAHVGQSSVHEEEVAESLGAKPNKEFPASNRGRTVSPIPPLPHPEAHIRRFKPFRLSPDQIKIKTPHQP